MVLGCAGAGKTTLARRLGEALGAPVICLDEIWRPDRGEDQVGHFRDLMREAHAGDAWISDGNFALATFDIRLPRAELVVWLDRPRLQCAWRAIVRVFRPGEANRIGDLPKVLRFIRGFDRINRPRIETARETHGAEVPVVRLRSDRETEAFVASLVGSARSARRPGPLHLLRSPRPPG